MTKIEEPGKKDRILQAAIKIFSRKGFHQVKVEEVAEEAGVGKGTLYDYFQNKEHLLQEAFRVSCEQYLEVFDRSLESSLPFWQGVKEIINLHFSFLHEHEEMSYFVMESYNRPLETIKEWLMEVRRERLEVIQRIMKKGIEEGEIRPVDVEVASRMLLGLVFAVCPTMVIFDKDLPREDTADKMVDMFRRGLEKD
ncbi:MAG: TetR/AcrR family transcriptional regulator [Candidatus Syntrophonatronum acetioxidans]|uniref:TetR/AcrR family transcriptional regulator n=1 Tax=Candidatus Syntrophonatronum acetioxidans TaxID=1795816 RepID=A0A424YE86_9FIRM|nr:MAG: TetR/AcrR family transcriptional regulator [Candidatus Syntrophonatronum acetioxidans]